MTLDRVAPFPGRYVLRRGFSTVVATDFADGSMDFVYLDALHSYRDGMNDILAWWPKVEWGLGEEWSESALALVRAFEDDSCPQHALVEVSLYNVVVCVSWCVRVSQVKKGGLFCGDDYFTGYLDQGTATFGNTPLGHPCVGH